MRRSAQDSRIEVVGPDPDRDRFIDLVRVISMITVVALHWLSVMPALTATGKVVDKNVVAVVPGLWPLTWAGDVMALFVFAGGYANWVSLTNSLLRGRVVRVLPGPPGPPTAPAHLHLPGSVARGRPASAGSRARLVVSPAAFGQDTRWTPGGHWSGRHPLAGRSQQRSSGAVATDAGDFARRPTVAR